MSLPRMLAGRVAPPARMGSLGRWVVAARFTGYHRPARRWLCISNAEQTSGQEALVGYHVGIAVVASIHKKRGADSEAHARGCVGGTEMWKDVA